MAGASITVDALVERWPALAPIRAGVETKVVPKLAYDLYDTVEALAEVSRRMLIIGGYPLRFVDIVAPLEPVSRGSSRSSRSEAVEGTTATVETFTVVRRFDGPSQHDVYLATHPSLGKVVVKNVGEPVASRVLRSWQALQHVPHLVRVLCVPHGRVITKYMPGDVGTVPPCGSADFFAYFSQLLECLVAMAAARYVHCDLRPENIVFDSETQRLTVIDLEYLHDETRDEDPTWNLTGTYFTYPPEHDLGKPHRHWYTDSWAVGVLYLLSMCTLPMVVHPPHFEGIIRDTLRTCQQEWGRDWCAPAEILLHADRTRRHSHRALALLKDIMANKRADRGQVCGSSRSVKPTSLGLPRHSR